MNKRRRFWDRLLFSATIFMALLSIVMLFATIQTLRQATEGFRGNLLFYATQVEYETNQVIHWLDRYQSDDEDARLGIVQLRFDILWSRVSATDGEATLLEGADDIPETAAMLEDAQKTLMEIEPLFAGLERQDTLKINFIKSRLRDFLTIAHKLTLAANHQRARYEDDYFGNQLRQGYLTFAFLVGMAGFALLSSLLLRSDKRHIEGMNLQLEDRVRVRTEDLQAANVRLASEVAERKRSQSLAAERETRLQTAAQLAKLGYFVWNVTENRCEFCSDQYAASFGLTPDEMSELFETPSGILSLVHQDDQQRVQKNYADLRAGKIVEMEYRILSRAGTRRLREVARPIFDITGRVTGQVHSAIDITEQHETELKLFEAQKMDSIGKMTGGVAHDFNNLLAVILGNLELLKEVPDSEDRDEMIDDAIGATLRGRDLTMSMLSFARRAPLDPVKIDLNSVIADLESLLRRTMPENISIEVALSENIWTVMADRSLTESALLNLAINAREAMPNGGNLTIETENVTLHADTLDVRGEDIDPGEYVMMAVSDTGKGIKKEMLEKIFDPFFSTKAMTKNSGLGLSMVHGFVRQTGGAIRVYSEPNVGTSFKLFFKSASPESEQEALKPTKPVEILSQDVKVLLVEDDDTVRKILSKQLSQRGVNVVAAAESASAEKAFRTEGPFNLVISDIVMPGDLQGPALVRRLREFQPDLPAVFLSGYPQEATVHGNGVKPEDITLMKPVSSEALLSAINEALILDPSAI